MFTKEEQQEINEESEAEKAEEEESYLRSRLLEIRT